MARDIRSVRFLLASALLAGSGIIAVASALPVHAAPTPPTPSDVAELTESPMAASPNNPEPGDEVTIELPAGTFTAGEDIGIYLYPDIVDLNAARSTQLVADADGSVTDTVTIPANSGVGALKVVVFGDTSGDAVAIPITVVADVTANATDIDYDQPGQFNMEPCSSATDSDCIESVAYVTPDGDLIEGGYLEMAPDPGFTCRDGHISNVSGSYWNVPGLETLEGGSTILTSSSLTTPGFNHDCSRSGERVQSLEKVAERVFVGIYSATNENGNYNQHSVPKPNCQGDYCSVGVGPVEDVVIEVKVRVSGFAMAYAYTATKDTVVSTEALSDGGALITLRGAAVDVPGVGDGSSFSEGSLRTTEQADYLANTWFFELKNANDPGFPSACSEFGFPVVSGNHAWGGQPEWDDGANELRFNMGAPHLRPDGEKFEGSYEARIPVAYAECLWGIDPASLVTDLEVAVIDEDGSERAEGEFDASITIVDDMLHIDADGFHFSEPDVVVRSTGGFVALDEPVRILNTRDSDPVGADDLGGSGDPYTLQVTGSLVPTTATAVALNVTVVNGQANDFGGYVTVYPCGTKP
ncbi:MAG: hypothetical protein RIR49_1781, partial [Actinomycetota bacterium]